MGACCEVTDEVRTKKSKRKPNRQPVTRPKSMSSAKKKKTTPAKSNSQINQTPNQKIKEPPSYSAVLSIQKTQDTSEIKKKTSQIEKAISEVIIDGPEGTTPLLSDQQLLDSERMTRKKKMPTIPEIDQSIAHHFAFYDSQIKLLEEPEQLAEMILLREKVRSLLASLPTISEMP